MNQTIVGIGSASLLSDIGHEMATTAMPALLVSIGAGAATLGLIEGVADGTSAFVKLASGLYSDKLKRRKPLAVGGYIATAIGMASFAFVTQWWQVLLGRTAAWIGRGARSPVRSVLLTEATRPENYGRAFGLERAMDSAGAVIGPLLSLWLVTAIGLRRTFALTLIPGVLAALAIATMVRERPHAAQPQARLLDGIGALPDAFKRYLAGVGIAGLGDFSNTLLILWATQAWTPGMGRVRAASLAMLFYVGYNVIYTVSCYLSGGLADRFDKHLVLAVGYASAAIPAAALLWPAPSLAKFAVVFGVSGLYMGVWETLEGATAASILSADYRGTGFGVLATVNGLGDLVSSPLVGFLWVRARTAAMLFVIATSLIGAAVVGRLR
ncbi:MAG TPA: MFS transporter [Candidatus Binataceae bacterium]